MPCQKTTISLENAKWCVENNITQISSKVRRKLKMGPILLKDFANCKGKMSWVNYEDCLLSNSPLRTIPLTSKSQAPKNKAKRTLPSALMKPALTAVKFQNRTPRPTCSVYCFHSSCCRCFTAISITPHDILTHSSGSELLTFLGTTLYLVSKLLSIFR